ncbi:MAG TPA: murein biosynthesis integral membrane protein MurJ [Candidatus Limnocylindria bacterium]|nr:murein biosynthesis integral membrane protein MurJ [Candidatus Limnocylindria bacterium]
MGVRRAGTESTEATPDGQLARRAGVVSAAVFASRILGVVREQVFAGLFGAGRELDAFVTAFRIPNLLRDLFAEGALSAAFVATFTQHHERRGPEAAWRLANLVVNTLALTIVPICLLGIAFAPAITRAIAPGFVGTPGKVALTVELTRIMMPFLLLVALAAIAMGILNTRNRFGVPALASAFFNLGSIVGGIGCAWWFAPGHVATAVASLGGTAPADPAGAARAIVGMAIGTLVGGLLQLLVQVPSLRRVGFRYRPILDLRDPGVHQVVRLMAPATIGAAAVQVNVFVNSNFASYLGDGPVSWLNVAFRFMQLPIGLFGVAVGTVALPALSRHAARKDLGALRGMLRQALVLTATLSIPAAAALAAFGVPVIGLIYEHGRFHEADTAAAARALAGYALGLAGYAGIKVVTPAFYALDDARTPMRVALLSIGVNLLLNWLFVRQLGLGHVGLAVSTSCVAIANFALLAAILGHRVGAFASGLGIEIGRILLATLVMVAAAAAAEPLAVRAVPAAGPLQYAARVAALGLAGGAAYLLACRVLGVGVPRLRRRPAA